MSDTIHIVCLDAPSPPDYGGSIDMFYKIRALHQIGKKIILHYFDYRHNRNADLLKDCCIAIYSYMRKPFLRSFPLTRPFIVSSRNNVELVERLNKDQYPVLLEGLHCTGIIPGIENKQRVIVRIHNEESAYYHHLAQAENSWLRRNYFLRESRLLSKYQRELVKDISLACLSESDLQVMKEKYGFRQAAFIPCFLPWQEINSVVGQGDYCLYHGNLTVPENDAAAKWLIKEVFCKTTIPFVIAGNGISDSLRQAAKEFQHISFVNNPSIVAINNLVRNAQINVLPSLNNTGVKLKLLNALLNGRHCITNNGGVAGSRIKGGVFVADEAGEWLAMTQLLVKQPFTQQDKNDRQGILSLYDNLKNAEKLSALWSHCQ